ncbi:hypothetical protein P8452_38668 [Trifolium repens]|nr:protein SODIUM POTASSIUM ROOT DEFECTIVE [Trifolium repens]WJX52569.1 hypothetical protein P8452_38668 [Trifolium repens]
MIRGFMCHSQSSTAVCMSTRDSSHVIVPKRIEKNVFHDDTRLINFAKYSKLVESPMSNHVPKIILKDNSVKNQKYQAIEPRELQKTPTTDNVFQVVVMRVAIHTTRKTDFSVGQMRRLTGKKPTLKLI